MKKRKQSFLHLVTLLAFLALICAGVFWAIHQQSAPTADAQDGPTALELEDLTPLSVPLLPDEACSTAAQEMVEQLPDSPIIARVEATSSSMSHDGAMVQRFYVVDVYAAFEDAQENPCNADLSAAMELNLDFHPNAYGHSLIAQVVMAAANTQMETGARTVSGQTTQLTQRARGEFPPVWAMLAGGAGVTALAAVAWLGTRRRVK